MPRYLLAAEADKIQDYVFRASLLREVVGGSQLLTRLHGDRAAGKMAGHFDGAAIVNDGGSFRIRFEHESGQQAHSNAVGFGRCLAALYHHATGGSLTVGPPVSYQASFQEANEAATRALRRAKSRGEAPMSQAHLPYLAFCASCGVEVAAQFEQLHETAGYVCRFCREKRGERDRHWREVREGGRNGFLGRFVRAIEQAQRTRESAQPPAFRLPTEAGDVGKLDPRRYVGYLLADGNGMGAWFSRCDEVQIKELSSALTEVLYQSLAAACPLLLDRLRADRRDDAETEGEANQAGEEMLPVLPLILGGDDLFALISARFALDFVDRFCRAYETEIAERLNRIGLLAQDQPGPTVAAALVICKESYPYRLAHRRAASLLKGAKGLARRLEVEEGIMVSCAGFELITGNQLAAAESMLGDGSSKYQATMAPYLAVKNSPAGPAPAKGIALSTLLRCRQRLERLPRKRLAELQSLYDQEHLPNSDFERDDDWRPRLDRLRRRIGRNRDHDAALTAVLEELGGRLDEGYWRTAGATYGRQFQGHGLPDLLRVWRYAESLEQLEEVEE